MVENMEKDLSSVETAERTVSELFEELKKELFFLPANDHIRKGYLFGFKYTLIS